VLRELGQWQYVYCLNWKCIDMMKTGMRFVASPTVFLLTRAGGLEQLTPRNIHLAPTAMADSRRGKTGASRD
jgi:hypothetical protein